MRQKNRRFRRGGGRGFAPFRRSFADVKRPRPLGLRLDSFSDSPLLRFACRHTQMGFFIVVTRRLTARR